MKVNRLSDAETTMAAQCEFFEVGLWRLKNFCVGMRKYLRFSRLSVTHQ